MPLTSEQLIADPVGRYPRATVACFDPTRGSPPRRELDEARTVEYLERLAAAGAEGLLIASSTGHGHLRSVPELEAWLRCAAGADTGDAVPMALLRPEDGAAANSRLLDVVAAAGYPVVFLRPGTGLSPSVSGDRIYDSLAPLVAAAAERRLAVGLYSIPDVSGAPLSPDVAARLVAAPGGDRIIAVKVTEADYEASTARFLAHPGLRHLKVVQGWDPHLGRALRDGRELDPGGRQRVGITSGVMALAVHQYRHLLAAAEAGDWKEVAQAQAAVTRLFEAMQDDPGRFADLQRAKQIMGLGHPLVGTVDREQAQRVLVALDQVPRAADRHRLARSLDLMGDGPYHERLTALA